MIYKPKAEPPKSLLQNRSIIIAVGTLIFLFMVSLSINTFFKTPVQETKTGTGISTSPDPNSLEILDFEPIVEPEGPPPDYLMNKEILNDFSSSESLGGPAFAYLLYQAKITKLDFLSKEAQPAPKPDETEKYKPGTPVTLEGKVRLIEKREEFSIPEVNIPNATLFEIVDDDGRMFTVYSVYRVYGIERGDRVSVTGFYYKHFIHQPGLEPIDVDWTKYDEPPILTKQKPLDPVLAPVIITKGPMAPQYMSDEKSIGDIRDREFGQEAKAFYYLLYQVQGLTQDQIKAQTNWDIKQETLRTNPASARGQVVVLDGALVRFQRRNEQPNIAGINRLYHCIIRLPEGEWLWTYTFEEPVGFKKGDYVRVYGKFFKVQRYMSQNKTEILTNVVMAKKLVPVEYKAFPYLQLGVLVMGLIILIFLAVAWRYESRSRANVGDHVRQITSKMRPRNIDELAKQKARLAHPEQHPKEETKDEPEEPKKDNQQSP